MGFWKTLKWNAAAISIGSVVLGVILAGWPAIAARTVCYLLAAVLLLGVWFKGDVSVGFIYMQF